MGFKYYKKRWMIDWINDIRRYIRAEHMVITWMRDEDIIIIIYWSMWILWLPLSIISAISVSKGNGSKPACPLSTKANFNGGARFHGRPLMPTLTIKWTALLFNGWRDMSAEAAGIAVRLPDWISQPSSRLPVPECDAKWPKSIHYYIRSGGWTMPVPCSILAEAHVCAILEENPLWLELTYFIKV